MRERACVVLKGAWDGKKRKEKRDLWMGGWIGVSKTEFVYGLNLKTVGSERVEEEYTAQTGDEEKDTDTQRR